MKMEAKMKMEDWVPMLEQAAAKRASEAHQVAGRYTESLMGGVLDKSQMTLSEILHARAKRAAARRELWLQRRLALNQ